MADDTTEKRNLKPKPGYGGRGRGGNAAGLVWCLGGSMGALHLGGFPMPFPLLGEGCLERDEELNAGGGG